MIFKYVTISNIQYIEYLHNLKETNIDYLFHKCTFLHGINGKKQLCIYEKYSQDKSYIKFHSI